MSLSDAEKTEGGLVERQRWFFPLISASQAETILSQESTGGRISRFVVSNVPPSKDYRLSVRRAGRKSLPNDVEHITISYNEEDQSYGIDEQNQYQSVIEVVRNYVVSQDFPLEPLSGSLEISSESRPMLMSLASIESSQMEEPPAYTTAVQYPTDKRPLPQIKTRLDPNKAQEATLQRSLRMYTPVGNLGESFDEYNNPSCYHWCCHPCHSGREWYSIARAGCLRQLCLILILLLLVATCGWQCGCCAATIVCCRCTWEFLEDWDDD